MQLILATNSKHKVNELKDLLEDLSPTDEDITIVSLKDINCNVEVKETGKTFEENADIKAEVISRLYPDFYVLSDDSGLCLEAINDFPGVMSHRFAGDANSKERCDILLNMLSSLKYPNNNAHFVCCMSLYKGGKKLLSNQASVYGTIVKPAKDISPNDFGYDPIFKPIGFDKTWAEMDDLEKDICSHRALAIQPVIMYLNVSSFMKSL